MKTVKNSSPSLIPVPPESGPALTPAPSALPSGQPRGQPRGTQYGLNFHAGDAWFYEWLGPLSATDRSRVVFAFLQEHQSIVIEYFVLTLMPESFVQVYEEKRSYSVKEAFRRAVRKIFQQHAPTRIPLLDAVIHHIRASGSFRIEDLGTVLGRTPVTKEIDDVTTFLSSLSNDDLRALLNSH